MTPIRRAFPLSLRAYAWLIAVLFMAICALAISRLDSHAGSKRNVDGPNVVIVQTDDQTLTSLNRRTMPNVHRLLADRGVTFTNHIVASPLCCPSRASLLTGQYPHNHRVRSNPGGYAKLKDKRSTLPAWLARAGYRTAHVGKFLNNYERYAIAPSAAAPGWHEWVTMRKPYGYFDYDLAVDGRIKSYGPDKSEYLSTVLNRSAARLVRGAAGNRSFFLALDHFAPHGQARSVKGGCGRTALPLPGDFRRFASEALPSPPSFAEDDLSDKPSFRRGDRLSTGRIRGIRDNYRCRLASLRAVDRGVKRIVKELRQAGELDDTVLVFTSDNGFLQGEHAIPAQKAQAYEEAIRVPLVIRTPATAKGDPALVEAPTANIDVAPTILELVGAKPCHSPGECRTMDGRSLVPLLQGHRPRWAAARALLTTFTNGHRRGSARESCEFAAMRTRSVSYVEHRAVPDPKTLICRPAFERELYDLAQDPYQLENRADVTELERDREQLADRLARLGRCAGVRGRDPKLEGRPFCE